MAWLRIILDGPVTIRSSPIDWALDSGSIAGAAVFGDDTNVLWLAITVGDEPTTYTVPPGSTSILSADGGAVTPGTYAIS